MDYGEQDSSRDPAVLRCAQVKLLAELTSEPARPTSKKLGKGRLPLLNAEDPWQFRLGAVGARLRRRFVIQRVLIWAWAAVLVLLVVLRQLLFAPSPQNVDLAIGLIAGNAAFIAITGVLQVTTKRRLANEIEIETGYSAKRMADRCLFSIPMYDLWLSRASQNMMQQTSKS